MVFRNMLNHNVNRQIHMYSWKFTSFFPMTEITRNYKIEFAVPLPGELTILKKAEPVWRNLEVAEPILITIMKSIGSS